MKTEINFTENETAIVDLIIAFIKEVYLKKPLSENTIWISPSFFPNTSDGKRGHIGKTIWISLKGRNILNRIISIFKEITIGYIERNSLEKIILDYIQNNLFNDYLFFSDSIFLSKTNTLFESQKYKNPKLSAGLIYKEINLKIKNNIDEVLFLYPVSRIKSPSFKIENENIEYLSVNDKYTDKANKYFPHLEHFNFENGSLFNNKQFFYTSNKIDGWIIFKTTGEQNSSHAIAKIKIKMFFGILFSILSSSNISYSYRSMAESETGILFFTNKDSGFRDIGNILHPFLGKIEITQEIILHIKDTYNKFLKLNDNQRKRFEMSSNYLVNSFYTDDIDKYINLFIALDALWGINGKSRKSIVNGIKTVIGDNQNNTHMANKLYDLRCEVIHGSCLLLDDWKDIDKFYNKYHNEPLRKLQTITFDAIKNVVL